MKKALSLFVLCVICLSVLSGCGHSSDSESFNSSTVIEQTKQNKNEKYSYSMATISTVNNAINPIQALAYTTQFTNDGEILLHADASGYYGVFSDPDTKISDFPTIVADGKLVVTPQGETEFGNPRVFDTDYQEYKYSSPGWNGLHLLPEGEYLVVFYEKTDTRNDDPKADTCWQTTYDNIFRLVIPDRKTGKEDYSLTFNKTDSLDNDYDINTKYRAGQRVELRLALVFEQYYDVSAGNDKAVMIGTDDAYVIYAFIMPASDTYVEIKTVSVEIPTK